MIEDEVRKAKPILRQLHKLDPSQYHIIETTVVIKEYVKSQKGVSTANCCNKIEIPAKGFPKYMEGRRRRLKMLKRQQREEEKPIEEPDTKELLKRSGYNN